MERLRSLVRANLGFDPSRDPDFAKLWGTSEFQSIMDDVYRQTTPVHNSQLIATLDGRDIGPENIAFDAKRSAFLLGRRGGAALLRSGNGKLLRTAFIEGKHVFNDLAISSAESVYVTDTTEGSVYQLPSGKTALEKIAPQHAFTAANGIAISGDDRRLYVSTWEDGIDLIDLQSGRITPMAHPADVCLAFIDGLYANHESLIAIQNGPMLPRIVELQMSANHLQIVAMKVLERRNPAFDGITTGVIVGKDLYYVANPQTDKQNASTWRPLQIFSVPVTTR